MNSTTQTSLYSPIVQKMEEVDSRFYRLIVLVLPMNISQFQEINQIAEILGCHYINIGLELSQRLLDIAAPDRPGQAAKLLRELVEEENPAKVCLDRLELLFDPSLKLNPLGILKELSRYRRILAIWRGNLQNGDLLYAEVGHPEYRAYSTDDIVVMTLN